VLAPIDSASAVVKESAISRTGEKKDNKEKKEKKEGKKGVQRSVNFSRFRPCSDLM
jgi:hypothetical protein